MKKNICEMHNEIMKIADNLSKLKHRNYETPEQLWDDIYSNVDDIYSLAYDAKQAGESMEARLKEYREAIEGLGFIRKTLKEEK